MKPIPHSLQFKEEGKGFRVLGVPLFPDHERSTVNNLGQSITYRYDREKLTKMAALMNARARHDNFKQAVHGDHTDVPGRNKRLCFAVNYRVEPYVFEGGPRWVIVCDWIARDRNALLALEDFPYRSVEVNPRTGEFSSIAVMESEGPYFKFPLFQLEGVPDEWRQSYDEERARFNYSDDQLVFYRENAEATMDFDPNKPDLEKEYMDPAEDDMDYMGGDDDSKPVTRGELKAVIAELLDEIKGGQRPQQPIEPVVNHRDDFSAGQVQYLETLLDGVLTPYRELLQNREEDRKILDKLNRRTELQDLLANAHRRTEHVSRPHDFDKQLTKKYREGGSKLANVWIDGMLMNSPPFSISDQGEEEAPAGSNLPEELVPYRDNPEKLRAAKALYEEFPTLPGIMRRNVSVKDYLEDNLGPAKVA